MQLYALIFIIMRLTHLRGAHILNPSRRHSEADQEDDRAGQDAQLLL